MSAAVSFPDPLRGFIAEQSLGVKKPILTIVPDAPVCEHIASLVRKNVLCGRGIVEWELRTAPGVRFPPEVLETIAARVEDGRLYGVDPCWRIDVRQS
jgi:hypothetical protein